MDIVLAFALGAMLLTGVVSIVFHLQWTAHLKRIHPGVWEALGSPPVRPYRSLDQYRRLRSFEKSGELQRIGDARLARLMRRARVVSRLYLAIFAVVFISLAGVFTGLW